MSSQKQETSHLFEESTNDDPFSQLTSSQLSPDAGKQQPEGVNDVLDSIVDDSNDKLSPSANLTASTTPVNEPITSNASADSFFDEPLGTGTNTPQKEQAPTSASALAQPYDPNTHEQQQYEQIAFDNNQQQPADSEQQYDRSQWTEFDPNVHYYYDEHGGVHYYDPNTNQEYDMTQYGYDENGQYQYDPQYAEYYAQQGYDENGQYQYDPQYAEQSYDSNAHVATSEVDHDSSAQQQPLAEDNQSPVNEEQSLEAVTFTVPEETSLHTPDQSTEKTEEDNQGEHHSYTPIDEANVDLGHVSPQSIHETTKSPDQEQNDTNIIKQEVSSPNNTDSVMEKVDEQEQSSQHQDADFAPLVVNAVEPQENQSLEFDDIIITKEDQVDVVTDAEMNDPENNDSLQRDENQISEKEDNEQKSEGQTTQEEKASAIDESGIEKDDSTSPEQTTAIVEEKQKEQPVENDSSIAKEESQTQEDQLPQQSIIDQSPNEGTQSQENQLSEKDNRNADDIDVGITVEESLEHIQLEEPEKQGEVSTNQGIQTEAVADDSEHSAANEVEEIKDTQGNDQSVDEGTEEQTRVEQPEEQTQAEETSDDKSKDVHKDETIKHENQAFELDAPAVIPVDNNEEEKHTNIDSYKPFQSYEPHQFLDSQNPSSENQQHNSFEAQQDHSCEPEQSLGYDDQQNTGVEAQKDEPQQDTSHEPEQSVGFESQQSRGIELQQTFSNDAQYVPYYSTQQDSIHDTQQTPSYDHQQNATVDTQEVPSHDGQETFGYGSQQAVNLEHYEPQHTSDYGIHQSTNFEPQQDVSYEPQQDTSFEPQETSHYEPQQNASYQPQQTGGYESQENVSYEPQQATTFENQQGSGYEPQQGANYEPNQTAISDTQPHGGYEPYQATNVSSNSYQPYHSNSTVPTQHYYAGYYNQPESIERSATVPLPVVDRASSPRPQLVPCPDPLCEGENKPKAKFCCECGRPLMGVSRATTPAATSQFGFSPISTPPQRNDVKIAFKDSLDKFIPNSVILHPDRDIQEKRQLALDYINSRTSTFEGSKALLWNIVKLMLEYPENKLGDGGALDKAIIHLIYTKEEDTVTITRLDELENILLEGDKEKACEYAKQHDMWGHSLIIASTIEGGELYKSTITEFISRQLFSPTTELVPQVSGDNKALRMLYSVFQGAGASSVDEFVKQRADEDPVYTAESLKGWKRALALILANRSKDDQYAIHGLGDHLGNNEARLCYFLSPDVDNSKMLGSKDLDDLYLIELYEFASQAVMQPDYKLVLAWWLTELGFTEEPKIYCESIVQSNPALESLKQLGDTANESENVASLLSKATFDSLIGSVETKLDSSYGQPAGYGNSYTGAADTTVPQPINPTHGHPISSPFGSSNYGQTTSGGWWDSNVAQPEANNNTETTYQPGTESNYQTSYQPTSTESSYQTGYTPADTSYQTNYTSADTNYQPDAYAPASVATETTSNYQPNTYAPAAASYDDDDDDLGFGNTKTRKVQDEKKEPEPVVEEKKETKEEPEHKGWGIFSLFHRNKNPDSDEKKPVKANLGSSENTFYFDENLKKWVNKSAGAEPAAAAALPPPPKSSTPAPVKPNSMPPSRVGSAPTVGGPPSVPPPSFNTPPVSTRRGAGGKKPMRSRYVDVLNTE